MYRTPDIFFPGNPSVPTGQLTSLTPLDNPVRPFIKVSGGPYTYVIRFPELPGGSLINPGQSAQPEFRIYSGNVTSISPDADTSNCLFYLYRKPAQQDHWKSFLGRTVPVNEVTASGATTNYSHFVSGDYDVRVSGFSPGSSQYIYVGFCVVAYGRDSNFSPIYSEAVVINAGPAYPVSIQFF